MPTIRRSWRLGYQDIIFKRDLQDGETAHPFFLGANLLSDPFARRGLAEIYQSLRSASPGDMASPEVAKLLLRAIQQAIAAGILVSVRKKGGSEKPSQSAGGGANGDSTTKPRKRNSSPPPPSDDRPEKTWVDVQLIDQDGTPVPNASYKLKITDGSIREGTLDTEGRVRVSGIDPGSCTVWFPGYDAKEWRLAS